MKTSELRAALATFKHIGTKKTLAIMEHIRLRGEAPGVLRMSSCDVDSETEFAIEANIADMDLCVPAQRFAAIVANAGEDVEMKPVQTGLSISGGGGRFRLPTLPGKDMPSISLEGDARAMGDYKTIREAIAVCRFASGKLDIALPAINGVSIRAEGGRVTVTAANRRVVASQSFELMVPDFDIILHAKATEIAIQENYTLFSVHLGVLQLIGQRCSAKLKLMGGIKYPSMAAILNPEKAGFIAVQSDALARALEAMATVHDAKVDYCLVRSKDGVMEISLGSSAGQAEQRLDCKGSNVEFHINTEQLLAITKRSEREDGIVEFYWGKGFPVESGTPILTRNGALTMGSVTARA